MSKSSYVPTPEESKVISIMQSELASWQEGNVYVTPRVSFVMTNVIKKARKNFYGIFDSSKDPITGREKIFVTLTEWTVEDTLKEEDIDTKDITVKSRNGSYLKAEVMRMILSKYFSDMKFGQTLNRWLRLIVTDGTAYLKASTYEGKLEVSVVDALNIIADPSVECLDESTGIMEKTVLSKPEFDELNLDMSEYASLTYNVDFNSVAQVGSTMNVSQIPYVEVWQRYGYLPRSIMTGSAKDDNKFFYGVATVSGLNAVPVVHSVVELKNDEDHPYCEGVLKRVPGRRHGRGVPEMLFNIQAYLNETINMRVNRSRITQLGLFKGQGNVTPQQFSKLFTTGMIKLDANSDINPINMGGTDPATYRDEDQSYQWASRVTGNTDDFNQAASRPATNAIIEQQGANKGHNLRMENILLALSDFIQEKMLPVIKAELKAKKGELYRITGDPKILAKLDEALIRNQVYKNIEAMSPTEKQALAQSGIDIETFVEQGMESMKALGEDRHIELIDDLFDTEYDIQIVAGDESVNRATLSTNLQAVMGILAQSGMPIREILREYLDTLGLNTDRIMAEMPETPPQQQLAPGAAPGAPGEMPQGDVSQSMPTP